MVFSRGLLFILLRVLILVAFVFGLSYSYYKTDLLITPIMFGVLILISAFEITWYLQRQERGWTRFLLSVRHRDFNRAYKRQTTSKALEEAYELITQSLEELESGKQAEYHLLRMVLGHISIAVACYSEHGEVLFSNKAFNTLLGIPGLVRIDRLQKEYPKIHEVMTSPYTPAEWIDHKNGQKLFVKTESFKLKGKDYKLISLTDIKNPLDAKEFESYQKLMRVMTHEIMNSATPILSLISVVNKKLINDHKLVELDKKDQHNVAISLQSIEDRTAGILKFVDAYKQINRPIEPNLGTYQSSELEDLVNSLVPNYPGIKLIFNDQLKDVLVFDKVLISLVLNNLIKNAAQAVAKIEGGEIQVSVSQEGDLVSIAVEDNGPGIPDKIVNQIFIPFFTTKVDGSGVGLALSRKIARAHGGTLEYYRVRNQSRFMLSLPYKHGWEST